MCLRSSLLVFALTFLSGIGFTLLPTFIFEKYEPAFTKEEAELMIGQPVRNAFQTKFTAVQCSESGRKCSSTKVGERGVITSIKETAPNRYFIVVKWESNQSKEAMFSYCGRMTTRVSLEFKDAQK